MSMNEDEIRLRHMLDASREVLSFIENETRTSLDSDRKLVRALSMSIGMIGEAASKTTDECRATYPDIPWQQIIAMRNFLFHAYFKVDLDILWNTAVLSAPKLIDQLVPILEMDDGTDEANDEAE